MLDNFTPPMTPPWSSGWQAGASCSARPTWTSSRWARPTRPASTDRCATPGTRARPRRLLRRLGGGGRGPALRRRHRHRHRRLHPPARGLLRHHRHQAHLRALLALGHDRVRLQPRPGRRAGRSAADAALLLGAMAGFDPRDSTSADEPVPDYTAGPRRRHRRPEDRPAQGVLRRRTRPGRRRIGGCRRSRNTSARRQRHRHQPAQRAAVGAGLLRGRPGRVLVQPGPLRRRALRPPLRRAPRPGRPLQAQPRRGLRRRGASAAS
jgi:hypothetical protein